MITVAFVAGAASSPSRFKFALELRGPEWEPLRAYAEGQGITIPHAARELLLASLQANAASALFQANARIIRHRLIARSVRAATKAAGQMLEELRAEALALGIDINDLG